jgi:3-oxoacyl-[acyl-carrier protein] reductase
MRLILLDGGEQVKRAVHIRRARLDKRGAPLLVSPQRSRQRPKPAAGEQAMRLESRVALVTGASRGIGRAIAEALASEGAAVGVNYRSGKTEADEVVAGIEAAGGRAVAIGGDVSDFAQAKVVVDATAEALGGLHILVNNAGIAKDKLIYNMEPEDWLSVMQVNFGGVFNCTKAALTHFMAQRDGVIVNVSSVMGEGGWIGQSNYSASKGAVNAFTRCAAVELARFGVRVNALLPGFAPTDIVAGLLEKDGGKGITKQIPMKKLPTLDEIARTAVFLAGPDASYMTGSMLTVDGGANVQIGMGRPI